MNPGKKYDEIELVDQLKQRSEKAYSYLYDNYAGALYGIIHSIIPDNETANDVVQDVFINIWTKIDSYDPSKGRLFTWMLNIARNAAIDKLRSKGYRHSLKNQPLSENVDINAGAASYPVINDVGLRKVISQLKEEQRALLDLSYFQGFTHEEIAKAMNIPLGTVKTRIRTALIQLRTLIQ
ncbi:MAG TPA: sigma-70 family RNA polymerase sigma factor [Chitinophagaceae bacterium]|nr:sigma-70 family RNA polymerase sigma factor [Chitinophagaceae bacterium]